MGRILCKKHGAQGISLVCPHIERDVLARRHIDVVIRVDAEYLDDLGWTVRLCQECAARNGFSASVVLHGDEGMDRASELEEQRPAILCFQDLRPPESNR